MALAIAASSFPNEKLAFPAVLMYLLVNALLSFLYLLWRKRSAAPLAPQAAVR